MKVEHSDTDAPYFRYWGKAAKDGSSYHLLPYHCLDVAAVGKELLDENPYLLERFSKLTGLKPDILKKILLFFLSLHDIGKFSETFQYLIPGLSYKLLGLENSNKQPYTKKFGHDSIGFMLWNKYLFKELICCLEKENGAIPNKEDWKEVLNWFAEAAFGHHGVPGKIARKALRDYWSEADKEAVAQFVNELLLIFPIQDLFFIDVWREESNLLGRIKQSSWLIGGFFVVCDWIGSGQIFQYSSGFDSRPSVMAYWKTKARLNAKKAVKQSGILPCASNRELDPLSELLDLPDSSKLTPLQNLVKAIPISATPQLFIIEDETGAGKTEASLILLNRLMAIGAVHGFYFALPTMATADGIFPRVQKTYNLLFSPDAYPSLVLSHSSSRLSEKFNKTIIYPSFEERDLPYDDAESRCQAWITDNRKKTLLAHAGVGTVDQVFLSVLKAKYQSIRLFGLLGKVLIIDEAHAYDAYMGKELEILLMVHSALGGSAVIMSATLPFKIKQNLCNAFSKGLGQPFYNLLEKKAYPLLTHIIEGKDTQKEIPFTSHQRAGTKKRKIKFLHTIDEVDSVIEKNLREGKCVCWIRNTVRDARQSFQRWEKQHSQADLFHARFTIRDRLSIQGRVLEFFGKNGCPDQRKGRLLIATQVVEQSLDIDFDVIISDLAPIDLLLQRAGRLHRHNRDQQGNLKATGTDARGDAIFYLYTPEYTDNPGPEWFSSHFPNAKRVYENHARLWLGLKQLINLPESMLPANIRALIEETYSPEAQIPTGLERTDISAEGNMNGQRAMGIFNAIVFEAGYCMEEQVWPEDLSMPTRLGEETITLTLAKWSNDSLMPFNNIENQPWYNSEIRVVAKNIKRIPEFDGSLRNEFEKVAASLPSRGKWTNLLPVIWNEEKKIWVADIINSNEENENVYYHEKLGLMYAYEFVKESRSEQFEMEELI